MSINSKTDRFGIDIVIESLQQMSEPRLLAFWSNIAIADYVSYPRANKNPRGTDEVPEISLDATEYKPVLFDDTLAVTSFWIVSDTRIFNDDTKQVKATISIIFQANLKTIYAQTNRADEEFNANVLDVFAPDNFFINSDLTIVEGIDNVYSDLTFTEDLNDNIKKHDMSEFHVVKFTMDVIYDPDCFPVLAAVCPPGGTPVTVEFQGTPTAVQVAAGTTVDFQVVNAASQATLGALTTDTGLVKKVDVTIPAGITIQTGTTGQEATFRTGDDGDRFLNGDYLTKDLADLTDYYTLTLVNPDFPNHSKRLTGDTGGYMDEATGSFFDLNNAATTKALAFPNDILRDYAWRRRWFLNRSGARTWDNAIDLALTDSRGGETGWFLPNKFEYETLSSNNSKSPTYIDSRLFNWSATNLWSSTTDKTSTTLAQRYGSSQDVWLSQAKTQVNPGTYVKLF